MWERRQQEKPHAEIVRQKTLACNRKKIYSRRSEERCHGKVSRKVSQRCHKGVTNQGVTQKVSQGQAHNITELWAFLPGRAFRCLPSMSP